MTQPRQTLRPPLRRVREAFTAVTGAAYTAKAGDQIIGVNRAGTVTITLPTAQLRSGRIYTIKDESGAASANNITIATEGAETIDGSATDTISEDYGAKAYYSDGTNWFTVQLLLAAPVAHINTTGKTIDDHHTEAHDQANHTVQTCRVTHSADQSISGFTLLAFDTERFDNDAMHDVSTNNSRITFKTAGKYLVIGNVEWKNTPVTSYRSARIRLNGITDIAQSGASLVGSANSEFDIVSTIYDFSADDYVELGVFPGETVVLKKSNQWSPEFMAMRLS